MGGSGGGSSYRMTHREVEQLRNEAQVRLERSRLDAEVNAYLQAELSRINDRDIELVEQRLTHVEGAIEAQIEELDRVLFGGSVAKHTYVDGLSDIDALVVLNPSTVGDRGPAEMRQELLESLHRHLAMRDVGDIRLGQMAVTITYRDGMELQLLPAVARGDSVAVSSQDGDDWSHVRPKEFAETLSRVNERQGRAVVPAIKLAKAIAAQALPEKPCPNGYHMEALAVAAYREYEGSRSTRNMVEHFFDSASRNVLRPIQDVTGQSVYLDSGLGPANSDARRLVSRRFAGIARQMQKATSLAAWRKLLGE